jgi:mono/diheme cytochrome c family protein
MFHQTLQRGLMLLPLLVALWQPSMATADGLPEAIGRRIYLEGVLPSGQPLRGIRADLGEVSGQAGACVNCHRPSGLGMAEGTSDIPPITGHALFGGAEPVYVRFDRRFNPGLSTPHAPYDEASFAAALRSGHHQTGRTMDVLMPRYDLSDVQLQAVAAYLRTLSNVRSPGVSEDSIHLASVVTPGVDDKRRQAFINTLSTVMNQMNLNVTSGQRQRISVAERRLHSRRKLALDIWELTGPSSSWAQQLADKQKAQPVFALLSGLAKDEWQPVQDFCEVNHVGCWFPSLDLVPSGAEQSHYSLYFSSGIAVEADVIAHTLSTRPGRVLQWVGSDPVALGGAAALRRRLVETGRDAQLMPDVAVDTDMLDAADAALSTLTAKDTLVLWLRPNDLTRLPAIPTSAAQVFVSATLAGNEPPALAQPWPKNALLVQQHEIARRRDINLERFDAWQKASRVQLEDRRLQSEVYFAARSLVWTLRGMLNNLHTDYLIERAETGLSMFEAMQMQDELQAMMMSPVNKQPPSSTITSPAEVTAVALAAQAQMDHLDDMRKRGGTTVYPSLSLGQGQRIASKGAYLVSLNPDASSKVSDPLWVVP